MSEVVAAPPAPPAEAAAPVYDFDTVYDRRASDSIKWNWYAADQLPMWVADMDFKSPPAIVEMLHKRVDEAMFGYTYGAPGLNAAIVARMARLYGWTVAESTVVHLAGLVSGLNIAAKAVGERGDGVLSLTPVYGPFLTAPQNQERELHTAQLSRTLAADGTLHYEIDFDALQAAVQPNTRLLFFCHPHNPSGRAWTRPELEQLADFALRNKLVVCSDEIHCDLLLGGSTHIPFAALDPEIEQQTITLMAPSKTFNIPGLGASMALIPNDALRVRFDRASAGIVPHTSLLSSYAMLAAYTQCDDWLAQLQSYLTANRDYLVSWVQRELPRVPITRPQATYLAWLDLNAYGLEPTPSKWLEENAKLGVNEGSWFGAGGAGFVRLNFGCPRATLEEGLARLRAALPA